ncbi:hypothetical protein L1887_55995 [Cichorium endivia]|nr:hypothetical protein L1887_55995 [Cichorium endivia]
MLTLEPFSEDQGRSAVHPARGIPPISFLAPCGFTHPLTRTHVRLLGPCFQDGPEWGAHRPVPGARRYIAETARAANHDRPRRHLHEPIDSSGFGRRTNPHRSTPRVDRRTGYRRSTSDRDASPAPIRFPPDNFKHSLTLFSKGLGPGPAAEDASPDYNSDSEAVRFSSWADPGSLAVTKGILTNLRPDAMCPDKGCMVGGDAMRDAQAGVPSAGWLWAQLAFKNSMVHGDSAIHTKYMFTGRSAFAGFDNDPSAGSPTETLLRLLLPLNDKVQWNSRDVAGGEPPTSPRS